MLKRFLIGVFSVLAFSAFNPVNAVAVEASDRISIDESGVITLSSDHAEDERINTVQINLKVDTEDDADVSVEFYPENDIKVTGFRYDAETNLLNIYMSDSKPLFSDSDILNVGTVSVKDTAGKDVSYTVAEAEEPLKYVYDNAVTDVDVDFDIKVTTIITTSQSTTTTTTTSKLTTTSTTKTTATTTTTTTTSATTTTTTSKPTTTSATTTTTTTTTMTTTAKNIASDEKLCEWSINNYNDKNGIMPDSAEITETADGNYQITLTDGSDNILDVYVINPKTGIGTDSAGNEVNLPQTGNNSLKNVVTAVGAFMLTASGFCAVKFSGITRRKKNEQ